MIDLRSRTPTRPGTSPGAAPRLRTCAPRLPEFDRATTYVLYCEFGLKSAHLAELMREDGFDAFHFKGGTRALKGYGDARSN